MRKLIFFAGIASLLLFSCGKNEEMQEVQDPKNLSLTVRLGGENRMKAIGNPSQAEENVIYGFRLYVFYNGVLEKVTDLITGTLTYTIEGLTTGQKKVVAIANPIVGMPNIFVGESYARFEEVAFNVGLERQFTLQNGLVMTGETDITLTTTATNTVQLNVKRIVAKIKLGTITIDPVIGVNPDWFTLEGVAIMDAPSISTLGLPTIRTYAPLFGGLPGTYVLPENVKSELFEQIAIDDYQNRFFYVLAGDTTKMTLVGNYNGTTGYFVFKINPILRNTEHTINVTLRRLGSGSPSPDIPSDPTTLDVTIIPQDWQVVPEQGVVW